jgi:phosphatidate cytidylyltransferase
MTAVPLNVAYVLAGIFVLLLVASAAVRWLKYRHPEKDYGELGLRVRSWWVMVAIFSAAMIVSPMVSLFFFGFLSFLALKEYLSLIPTRRADRRVLFWAYAAIPLQYYWVAIGWYGMFIIFIPVYMLFFLPLRMITVGETSGFLRAIGTLHWGLMITVFNLSHVAFLFALPVSDKLAGSGAGLVLFLIFLTQFNDVAQYVWGKSLGKTKIVPKVSPKKTLEGLVGGVASTCLLAVGLAPILTPLQFPESVLVGLLIGLTGFIGDVIISALKRDLGIKDSGSLLPGHGGILDRIDSLTYTAPFFLHYVRYFHT